MAKGRGDGDKGLFPEIDQIISLLASGGKQELVILVVPSHDRRNQPLGDARTGEWADAAMRLLADLYRGATAFKTFKGIFKADDGTYLYDEPILIESYASEEEIQSPAKLAELVRFTKRMGRELSQAAVMLVIGQVMFYIKDYAGV
jgi:hypothetical protein